MLKLAGLVQDSIVDGPGIRVTVFAQGCPHHCAGCHNPETWGFEGGTAMSEEEVLRLVQENPLCRGVTFSGGEPFAQAEGFCRLARLLRQEGYEVASYTGYLFETLLHGSQHQRELLALLNVLIDGPFVEAQRSLDLSFRGSTNQRILDVPKSVDAGKAVENTTPRWRGE